MTDSIDSIKEIHDIKRISEANFSKQGFWGLHDYGHLTIPWDDMNYIYIMNLEKKAEKPGGTPILAFSVKNSPTVHLINGKFFKYKTLLGEKFAREHTEEECFRVFIEKFIESARGAYVDASVKDYLKGGTTFAPKATHLRAIVDYLTTVELHAYEEPEIKEEEKEQKIGLKVWDLGEVIDSQYKVIKMYKGGMGIVYIVSDLPTQNLYAVKMFQEQYLWDKQVSEMFVSEARVWIQLEKHENIVQALFVKTFQGCPALFLEYVEGTDLESELHHGALDVELALDLALQFSSGMTYAFEKLGIVHRDIKPSNCLLNKDWVLKITDFGFVKHFSDKEGDLPAAPRNAPGGRGEDDATIGTFAYMSPESFKHMESVDTRSDIYSFGIMFFEMLTGRKPIPGHNLTDYMKNHREYTPSSPSHINSQVPPDVSRIVLRCLEKNPKNRFPTFRELREALLLVFSEYTGFEYIMEKPSEELTAAEWTLKALSLATLGRHEDALKPFDHALEKSPKDANIWAKKGDSLVALNRLKDAIKCYDKAIMMDHRIPDTWVSKGNALFQLQDYEKSMFCFNNALKVDPDNDEVWVKKGIYYNIVESYDEALKCVDKAIAINPKIADAWYTKSKSLVALHRLPEALECSTKALEQNPLAGDLWHLQATIYHGQKLYEEAIERYEKAIEMNPEDADALLGKADCQFSLALFKEALVSITTVIERDDSKLEAWEAKGRCLFHMGEREEALKCFENILRRSPRHFKALCMMGNVLQDLFSSKEAKLCYDAAYKEKPDDPMVHFYRDSLEKSLKLQYDKAHQEEQLVEIRLKMLLEMELSPIEEEEEEQAKRGIFDVFKKKEKLSPEKLKAEGFETFARGEYETAVLLFSRYLNIIKDDWECWEIAGDALDHLGITEQAMRCYWKSQKYNPERISIWQKLLKTYEQIDNSRDASVCLLKMTTLIQEYPQEQLTLWHRLSHVYARMGSKFNVLVCLEQIIKIQPDDIHLKIKEFALLEEIGFTRLAQLKARYLLKILGARENETAILRNRGILLSMLGRTKEAVRFLDSALKTNQKDVASLIQKGDVLARRGEKQAALKCFMIASKYCHTDPKIFYFQGLTYEDLDDLDKAIKSYDIALKYSPNYEMPLVRKGFCLYKKEQASEAQDYYNKVLENNPHSAHAWEAKGLVMGFQKRYQESKWCFNTALEKEPINLSVLKNKALLFCKMELYQEAIEVLDTVLALDPLQDEGWNMKAMYHFEKGDLDMALKSCETALEIYPRSASTWLNKGFVLNRMYRLEEALICFERVLEIEYRMPEAFLNRAVSLCRLERYDEALSDFRIALKMRDKFALAWYDLGLWHIKRDEIEEAFNCFDTAISSDGMLADPWIDKGIAQIAHHQYEEALKHGEKAIQINPKSYRAWFLHGYAHACNANHGMAVRSYDRALRLKGDYIPALVGSGNSLNARRAQEGDEHLRRARELIMERNLRLGLPEPENPDLEAELEQDRLYNAPQDVYLQYEFSMKPQGHIVLFEESSDHEC
jgi:tetratricopeptide (TPR) repeat protein